MKKVVLVFIVICCCMLIVACGKTNKEQTYEEENRLQDEVKGVENGIWFIVSNLSQLDFTVDNVDKEVKYGWKFKFHEKFYKRLIEENETFYYRLTLPENAANILGTQITDFYTFLPFEEEGQREYRVEIPIKVNSVLTEDEIETIKNESDYGLVIYDKDFKAQYSTTINSNSVDFTKFFK